MYAQTYTPYAHNQQPPLTAFRKVADEYERLHPGIRIQFIDEEFPQYNDTLRLKATNGELWDVFWAQWAVLNGEVAMNVAVDLAPYFREKNPYIPDAPSWQAAMNQAVLDVTTAPNGAFYSINGDYVSTAFFYNEALFDQAGIKTAPQSWQELIAVARELGRAGIPAMIGVPYYPWWARHFQTDFYAKDYDRIAAFDKLPGISPLDEAVAIKKKLFSVDDPRFLGWWPVFKEFTDYWVKDYLTQPPDNNTVAQQDWVAGKAALFYSGSWLPNELRTAPTDFRYNAFNFPRLSPESSPLSTGVDTSNAVGGPSAGFQYAMSTPQANATMQERGKPEAVLDWLRYIGTPHVIEQVVNEAGSFVPHWPGIQPKPSLAPLAAQVQQPLRTIYSTNTSLQLQNDLQRLFGQYLADELDLEQVEPQVQQALDRALQDYISRTNVNLDNF